MVISGSAFHFLTHSGCNSSAYGGILPDPVTITGNALQVGNANFPATVPTGIGAIIDGKFVDLTAVVSGDQHYFIVEPGDYPTDADGRHQRAAASNKRN